MLFRRWIRADSTWSSGIQEKPVQELQGKKPVNLGCVVAVTLEMAADNGLDALPLQIRTRQRARIKQHFLDIAGQNVAVPNPVMVQLMSTEKETLQFQWRKEMIEPGQPLRHAVVKG